MNTDLFFQKIRTCHCISEQAEKVWAELLILKNTGKGISNYFSFSQHL